MASLTVGEIPAGVENALTPSSPQYRVLKNGTIGFVLLKDRAVANLEVLRRSCVAVLKYLGLVSFPDPWRKSLRSDDRDPALLLLLI